jgi:hypothetical protein
MKDKDIKVPSIGIDNKPKEKTKSKDKPVKEESHFVYPEENTGTFHTWERYPIGRNADKKPSKQKVVKDYLDNKFADFPENQSYPDLADIGLAD